MRRASRLAAVAVAALTAAACSSTVSKVTTAHAVANAFKADFDQSSISLEISLDMTSDQIAQLFRAGGGGAPAQAAPALAASSIELDEVTGHGERLSSTQAKSDADNSYELALRVNGSNPIDLRITGRTVYLRADVASVVGDFVGSQAASEIGRSFANGVREISAAFPGIEPLASGGWVKAPVSAFGALLHQLQAAGGQSSTVPQSESRKLISQLESAFSSNTTFTNLGDHGGRTEYETTTAAKAFLTQAESALSSVAGLFGGQTSKIEADLSKEIAKIPANQSATADLWVLHNKVQEIDVDLSQFIPKAHRLPFAVPLRVLIGPGTPVRAPAGASLVDLSRLPQLFGGLSNGATG
jgi:hypothetical protein